MACFCKCPDNKLAYMSHYILHRDTYGFEYTKSYIFCNPECLEFFKKNYTTEDENGYEYYNEIIDNTREVCPVLMIEIVNEYKKQQRILKSKLS